MPKVPLNESEINELAFHTAYAWTLAARDPACGGVTLVYVRDGVVLVDLNFWTIGIQTCYPWDLANCSMDLYLFNPADSSTLNMDWSFFPQDYNREYHIIESLNRTTQFEEGKPVWARMEANQGGGLSLNLYDAVKRDESDVNATTGLVVFTISPQPLMDFLKQSVTEGIDAIYVVDPWGLLIASTLENLTSLDGTFPTTSNVSIIRKSYAQLPRDLAEQASVVKSVDNCAVAYHHMATSNGFECYIIVTGKEKYEKISIFLTLICH